ncbi:MAG: rbsA [Microbacteriaceae bacterium]|nr:rbsA [Microbacteriaceae bacterium]
MVPTRVPLGTTSAEAGILLDVAGVSKSYSGVEALAPVSFTLKAGEVLGLVGENGAGKSTLIRLLSGAEATDTGEIRLAGRPVSFRNPSEAASAGIVTVYQEFSLFPTLTVAENMLFGQFPKHAGVVSWPEMYKRAAEFLAEVGLHLEPRKRVDRLSVAEKQMLEIARALHRHAQVLILDEPTAVLGGDDVDTLLEIIRKLKDRGIAIILVSHRLSEILEVSDSYLVLKDGKAVSRGPIGETSYRDLVSKMVGREFATTSIRSTDDECRGGELLRVENISSRDKLRDVSVTVHAGEVVGLAGLRGAGRTELMRAILGVDEISEGRVLVRGIEARFRSASDAIRAGLGLVPEERATQGAFLDMSIVDNIPLVRMATNRESLNRRRRELRLAADYRAQLRVRTASLRQRVRSLSGGNQQKVVLAKWLESGVQTLMLDEPTRGVDIGAKFEIYELIEQLRRGGKGLLVASSELPELLLLCDRVVVMHHGAVAGELSRSELSEESIMSLAMGGHNEPKATIENHESRGTQ